MSYIWKDSQADKISDTIILQKSASLLIYYGRIILGPLVAVTVCVSQVGDTSFR